MKKPTNLFVAREIINLLAKHKISINNVDNIFNVVKHELTKQTIQEVIICSDIEEFVDG